MANINAAPREGECLRTQTRFDRRAWLRFHAVVQLGPVAKPIIFPGPGFLIVAAPSRRKAMQELRKRFPDPCFAREAALFGNLGGAA